MQGVNGQFILYMLIIALGYAAKRFGIIKEEDGEGLSRVIFNFTLPALIISIISNSVMEPALTWLPVINVSYSLLAAGISLFLLRKENRTKKGMLTMVSIGLNVALFAYPLAEAIWGAEVLKYFAMFDMGSAIIAFGVIYVLAGYFSMKEDAVSFKSVALKMARSLPLCALIITLIVHLLGLRLPQVIIDISGILSKANMPLSLLLLGIYMGFSYEKGYLKDMLRVLGLRYILGISVGVGLYFLLPFDQLFRNTVLMGLILPAGASNIAYAVQFGYDRKFTATVTNISMIVSFVLVWVISVLV